MSTVVNETFQNIRAIVNAVGNISRFGVTISKIYCYVKLIALVTVLENEDFIAQNKSLSDSVFQSVSSIGKHHC